MVENYDFAKYENKEASENIPVVNVCELNDVESGVPQEERGLEYINERDVTAIYDKALRENSALPLFVGISHAGEFIPEEVLEKVRDKSGFVDGLDRGTAIIFSPREGEKYIAARNRISRLIADANRGPRQFQPGAKGIGGVTWKTNLQDQPIYNEGQEPTEEEMAEYVDKYYTPYYRGLHALAASLNEKMEYKEVLFLDTHSFPGDIDFPKYNLKAEDPKPLFILGNKDNSSASEEVTFALQDALIENMPSREEHPELYEKISDIVALNTPFKGVRNVEYWGHPEGINTNITTNIVGEDVDIPYKIHAIQLEMNMSTFFKDGKYDFENVELLRGVIQKAIEDVGVKLKQSQG